MIIEALLIAVIIAIVFLNIDRKKSDERWKSLKWAMDRTKRL